jgi:hypothetical protein
MKRWMFWIILVLLVVWCGVLVAQQPVAQGPQAATAAAWLTAVTQWAGGTLGAMQNYGTTPGAVLVPGVNAFVTNTVGVTFSPSAGSGAATTTFDLSATAATQVKGTAGNLYGYSVYNPNTTPCYLQFYNSAAATLGTSVLHPIGIQAGVTYGFISGTPLANFATAISTGETTTAAGSTQCTSAMIAQIIYF